MESPVTPITVQELVEQGRWLELAEAFVGPLRGPDESGSLLCDGADVPRVGRRGLGAEVGRTRLYVRAHDASAAPGTGELPGTLRGLARLGRRHAHAPRRAAHPLGASDRTRTLVVHREGYGDAMMVAGHARACAAAWRRVIWDAPPALRALFAESFRAIPNLSLSDLAPYRPGTGGRDVHTSSQALVAMLGATDGTPVLVPPALAENVYRCRPGVHVGIAWANAPDGRPSRGFPLSIVVPALTAAIPGLVLHALQVGTEADQADAFADMVRPDFPDFAATARYVCGLDCVVTPDVAACHSAGGCGVPTFTCLRHDSDWRWCVEGETTVWYQSMRLVRQRSAGDWAGVARRVAGMIRARDLPPRLGAARVYPPAPVPRVLFQEGHRW